MAKLKKINIDLEANKIALQFHDGKDPLTLHFDTPSRKFYLSVIAFIINEMKNQGTGFIYIRKHEETLRFLDNSLTGEHASKNVEDLWGKIRKAWRNRLPDLEKASLFKVLDRDLIPPYEKGGKYRYKCSEDESDIWANLFDYDKSNKWQYRFGVDLLSLGLNDISISFGDLKENEAWKKYMKHLGSLGDPNGNLKETRINTIPSRWKLSVYIAAAILIVIGGGVIISNVFLRPAPPPSEIVTELPYNLELPDKPSIAVLPFDNMSDDPKQEYFSDGITEEIITALSKIPDIFVIARNSTFTYKGKPVKVQSVGRDLGVQYVLEGSVRKMGDRVRITAQLNDTTTGHHLWAERYERDLKNIFAIQDEITLKILSSVQLELTGMEQANLGSKATDIKAYLKLLQGIHHRRQMNIDDDIKARKLFEEAIEIDPEYALAYDCLADTYLINRGSFKRDIDQALKLVKTALMLDEYNPRVHRTLARCYLLQKKYDMALAQAEKAVELSPNSEFVVGFLGIVLLRSGMYEEAIQVFNRAIRLNPLDPALSNSFLGNTYYYLRKYEEAIPLFEKNLIRYPNSQTDLLSLAACYIHVGREKEAQPLIAKVLERNPNISVAGFLKSSVMKDTAALNRRADDLRKLGLPE